MKIINLIGSGKTGGREKQLYVTLKDFSLETNHTFDVVFQQKGGAYFDKISTLKNVKVYILPNESEFSLKSLIFVYKIIRQYDKIVLHSPRIPYLIALLLCSKDLIYRISGAYIIKPGSKRDSNA